MVYVDDMRAPYGQMIMCHMTADSTLELLRMADRIGVHSRWIQLLRNSHEHFDICLAKRKLAVWYGAKEVTQREDALRIQALRKRDDQEGGRRP